MGIISKKLIEEIREGSIRSIQLLLSINKLSISDLTVLIMVICQLLYCVCASDTVLDEDGNYYVTSLIVKSVMPKYWQDYAVSLVRCRNNICHQYGTKSCLSDLRGYSSNEKKLREFAEMLLSIK